MNLEEQERRLISEYHNKHLEYNQSQVDLLRLLAKLRPSKMFAKKKKSGVYIYGNVGRGKSMLMDLYYNNCQIIKKKRVHFNDFMQEVHMFMYRIEDKKGAIQNFAKSIACNYDLLCLDEMQVNDIGDAMILSGLIAALFLTNILVIITGNYAPDELYKDGLQRDLFLPVITLIQNNLEVVRLGGEKDYRLGDGDLSASRFFVGITEATNNLKNKFNELTKKLQISNTTLNVYERNIQLEAAGDGFAWLSFSELCEKPLWIADYEMIAKQFHTIFITNIPIFNITNPNEMRRFTMLVDALYEHKNKLFCSMAAEVDSLCNLTAIPIEFQRTISRLHEMSRYPV